MKYEALFLLLDRGGGSTGFSDSAIRERPHGGFGGPGPGSYGHWGGWQGGHYHDHPGFFFVGAFPFWYPYYGSPYYYYYYDSPPPYYYYNGYNYNYAPRYSYN